MKVTTGSKNLLTVIDMGFDLKQNILNVFDQNPDRFSTLIKSRTEAIDMFRTLGFPTRKAEDWKYDNLAFLNKFDFHFPQEINYNQISEGKLSEYFISSDFNILVFINGFYSDKFSKIVTKSQDVKIGSLADAVNSGEKKVIEFISGFELNREDAFSLINYSIWKDGAYIYLEDGVEITEPVHILQIYDSDKINFMSNPRNLIITGKNCNLKLIESAFNVGDCISFANSRTEIYMDSGSNLEYYKLQNGSHNDYYIGSTQVNQSSNSVFRSNTITLSGIFNRNNLETHLKGENSESIFNGLYFINGSNFADNHTLADHSMPGCTSTENYKGIIDQQGTGVFNGKIIVRQNAQKTEAYQSNKNILLSDDATINTKPQLEILADDVKCSHGATSGYLDKDAMFYMLARGIREETARSLMLNAFATEIIEKISIPELREKVMVEVAKRLGLKDIYFCDFLENEFKINQ